MRNFDRKRSWKNIFESKPFLVVLGIVTLVFAWNVLRFWTKMRETERNKDMAEEKVSVLTEKKEKLLADIENLNTEEGKEKVFRENFGLAKEGEGVIVLVDDENPPEAEEGRVSKFFSFFKNLFK